MAKHPFAPDHTSALSPPVAARKPVEIVQHGESRCDAYHWLRDPRWQELLQNSSLLDADIRAHLDAENAYYAAASAPLAPLRERLFEEMRARIKEDDASVPVPDGPFSYGVRFRQGGDYPIYIRFARGHGAESILFDGDQESQGADFFDIADVSHSPDHQWVAYGVDRLGSEYFDIRIRAAATGEELAETIRATDGEAVWAADSQSFFYIERDQHQRPKRVRRHFLNSDPQEDQLVYEESDDGFFLGIDKTRSGAFIVISAANSTSSEVWVMPATAPANAMPELVAPRADNELYDVDHHEGYFYIHTNAGNAVDFKIMRTPVAKPGREHWQDWLGHEPGAYVLDFVPYADYAVRMIRRGGLPEIIIATYDRTKETVITFDEEAYALGLQPGFEFGGPLLRFAYSSPATPQQIFDYNMETGERTLLKTQSIPCGHNPSLYQVERLMITADDGAEIPVTVLRLKQTPVDGTAPLLLYGYGAYGHTIPAGFSTSILSVVDRGAVYAIAHIRGGAARGRQWYLDGKLGNKANTFSDFATVARGLTARGLGRPNETVIYGGSAGGLLVAATLNLDPELFGGAIGVVPFVDVLNTISDKTLPLTPPEWDEWGNPISDAAAYQTIRAYSPYENIRPHKPYPPILATGGLTDYRVTYWEPAKWIARLREEAGGGPFFLKMNMEAGHGGSAARFEGLREKAHEYAFALALFGLSEVAPVAHSD